jgi:phosphoribosylformylglycinamidine synthase
MNAKLGSINNFNKLCAARLEHLGGEYCWSLNRAELLAAQKYFRAQKRAPTRGEIETIAQTWSEHCKHKTFSGPIAFLRAGKTERIANLFKDTIVRATKELAKPWCLSVFKDNAGVIEFGKGGKWALAFKAETHNHPCAIEPYGGAETGVGGVIRDVLGVGLGAKPVLNTDVFCFAPAGYGKNLPAGALPPEKIMRGVVSGVRDYGNRMGIPTAAGAVHFDAGYLLNPLVFVGTAGIMPRWAVNKSVKPGDLIVCVGGRTGRDGIHGATFSSADIKNASSSAVQIGHPINEKKVLDALLRARDKKLYRGVTDCGAGGFSSAIGELGADCGARVRLERARLKDSEILPWEIWVSESQERMILAVPPENLAGLARIFEDESCELSVLGEFTASGRLVVEYKGEKIVDLAMKFLHGGYPRLEKSAVWLEPAFPRAAPQRTLIRGKEYNAQVLRKVVSHLNVCSREFIIRQYDHEVQGGTVGKPLGGLKGDGPSDACVIWPHAATGEIYDYAGFAVSHGINPELGKLSPHEMAVACVDEAVRNLVCVGADISKCAFLDNFCWGNPDNKRLLGGLVLAARGCYEAAMGFSAPFISGKDSFYNQAKDSRGRDIPIPSTLLISAVAPVPDVRRIITSDLKREGSYLYLIGVTKDDLGHSVYKEIAGIKDHSFSKIDIPSALRSYRRLLRAMAEGLVLSAHDLSQGGLGACLAEMAFAGAAGVELELSKVIYEGAAKSGGVLLYSETQSRIAVEVPARRASEFEKTMRGSVVSRIGATIGAGKFKVSGPDGGVFLQAEIGDLKTAWKTALESSLEGRK